MIIHTETEVLLRSDLRTFRLHGPDAQVFINAIVPLLDGSHDRGAVADALGGRSRDSVLALLDQLENHRILETIDSSGDDRWRGQAEFFRKWSDQHEESTERLRQSRILVVGLEPWGAAAAIELAAGGIGAVRLLDDGRVGQSDLLSVRLLSDRHLGRARGDALAEVLTEAFPWCHVTSSPLAFGAAGQLALEDTHWDLALAVGAREQLQLFQSLARFAHAHGIPSLSGYVEGLEAIVGPTVVPGRTACWNCARLRQLATSERPEVTHALQGSLLVGHHQARLHTYLAPMAPLVGHLLALEALKIVSRYTTSRLVGRILVQNLVTLETTFHVVIRMPWCDVCGGSSDGGAPQGGPVLGNRRKRVSGSGTRRLDEVTDPDEVRLLMAGWIDSRTGVIKHLMFPAPTAAGPELPIASAAILSSYTEGTYVPREMENTSGKGLTPLEAMIGAVGEAIERYSAARYRAIDLRRATLAELQGHALDPRRLSLYEDAQYDAPGFPFVRFDPTRPIAWTRGWWLDTGQPVWVPAFLTYLKYSEPSEAAYCQVTSNGLAAGVDLEDAATRAVLELVERDAFMITWLAQRPGRRLLIDDSLDAGTLEVVRQLSDRGVDLELLLLDTGLGIPVVACVGSGDGRRWPGVAVGLGAALSPRVAARKAILEVGLTGPYISRLMADGSPRIPRKPGEVRSIIDHALYYAPASRARALAFLRRPRENPMPLSEFEETRDSLHTCVSRLSAVGVRVAVVDVTSPDVAGSPFRVVRALGTNMQPFDFGFNLRRLANPRLKTMLVNGLNPQPHPLA